MTIDIQSLAKQAGYERLTGDSCEEFSCFVINRFATLYREALFSELLAGCVEPDTHCFDDDTQKDVWSYSKDQLAAAVLRERERCAAAIRKGEQA